MDRLMKIYEGDLMKDKTLKEVKEELSEILYLNALDERIGYCLFGTNDNIAESVKKYLPQSDFKYWAMIGIADKNRGTNYYFIYKDQWEVHDFLEKCETLSNNEKLIERGISIEDYKEKLTEMYQQISNEIMYGKQIKPSKNEYSPLYQMIMKNGLHTDLAEKVTIEWSEFLTKGDYNNKYEGGYINE